MTPVHINFIPSRLWRWVWAGALLFLLAVLGGFAALWMDMQPKLEMERAALEAAQADLQRLRAPKTVIANPRQASAMQATQQLQQDLNAVFAVVENLKIAGVRLIGMGLDTGADTLRLDYELDALALATEVTLQLNTGYESRPWKLGSVSASQSPYTSGPANATFMPGAAIRLQQGQVFKAHSSVRVSAILQ